MVAKCTTGIVLVGTVVSGTCTTSIVLVGIIVGGTVQDRYHLSHISIFLFPGVLTVFVDLHISIA